MCRRSTMSEPYQKDMIVAMMRESALMDMEEAHKKIAEHVPCVVFLLFAWWGLNMIYAIGLRNVWITTLVVLRNATVVVLCVGGFIGIFLLRNVVIYDRKYIGG